MNHGLKAAEIAERARAADEPGERSGTCAATTAPSATTPSPSTSAISAGTTPTRPTSIRCRPWSARRKTVDYMGGAAAVIARAREDFAKGEYRWVADAMSQVVFAEPDNSAARELGADALEQLGYQAESATWRNAYLLRRPRAAPRRLPAAGADRPGRRHAGRPHQRHVLRPDGDPPRSGEGRRPVDRHQLAVHRSRRASRPHPPAIAP